MSVVKATLHVVWRQRKRSGRNGEMKILWCRKRYEVEVEGA